MTSEPNNSFDYLRKEHDIIKVVVKILQGISKKINNEDTINVTDFDKIKLVLENMDKCHRVEEDQVLFRLKAKSKSFVEPIESLMIEHDTTRQIFKNIKIELDKLKSTKKPSQLLAKYFQDYAKSLQEHIKKEEDIFKLEDTNLLKPEDHKNILEQFKRVEQHVLGDISKGQMVATVIELQNRLC